MEPPLREEACVVWGTEEVVEEEGEEEGEEEEEEWG